jgi:DHA3 family tetracycline resistance protein-like MFS transporter
MLAHTRRFRAYSVYLILEGLYGLAFTVTTTVNLLYQLEIAKLNPLQLVLVGTVLETTAFLCQVPTGVLADLYSRRLSVVIGIVLTGLGFILEGSIPTFWAIAGGMAFYGVGATFVSGAEEAWLADELGEEEVGRAFVRGSQFSQAGCVLGAFSSVALASIRLNLPVIVGGCLIVLLGLFLLLVMPEHGFTPPPKEERQSWRGFATTFQAGFRAAWASPMLLLILGVGLFYGLASEGFDRLGQPHLQADFVLPPLGPFAPIVWFGLISVLGNLLVIGATELARRQCNLDNQRTTIRVLLALNLLGMLGLLVFAFSGNFFLAVAAFWIVGIFRGVKSPLFTAWLTRNSEPRVRATLISLAGQMDAIGQIIGGPPVGYLGALFSLRVALASLSAILAPVLLLYAAALRRVRGEPITSSPRGGQGTEVETCSVSS